MLKFVILGGQLTRFTLEISETLFVELLFIYHLKFYKGTDMMKKLIFGPSAFLLLSFIWDVLHSILTIKMTCTKL